MYSEVTFLTLVLIGWLVLFESQVEGLDKKAFEGIPGMENVLALLASMEQPPKPDPCEESKKGHYVSTDQLAEQATTYYSRRKYEEAANCYTEAIKKSRYASRKLLSKFHRRRGMCQQMLKNYKEAEIDHLKAVELQPDDFIARYILSKASLHVRNYDNVIDNSEKGIKILGTIDIWEHMRKDFREWISQARLMKTGFDPCVQDEKVEPGQTAVITTKFIIEYGETFDHEKNYDKAIQCYDKAISKENNVGQHYIARGITYMNKSEWKKGQENFEKAVELEPENLLFRVYLGYGYYFGEDNDKLLTSMEEAKKIMDGKLAETSDAMQDEILKLLRYGRNPETAKEEVVTVKVYMLLPKNLGIEEPASELS